MKTALEFLNEYQKDKLILQSFLEEGPTFYHSAQGAMYITDVMVEFAQLHVQHALNMAALTVGSWNAELANDTELFERVKEAYDLEIIKSY